jgi:hypothetical protein
MLLENSPFIISQVELEPEIMSGTSLPTKINFAADFLKQFH